MKKHWLLIVIVALLMGNVGITLWNNLHSPRIAYVRSQDLVYGYFGMKEAMTEFENKQSLWKANADTLRVDLENGLAELQQGRVSGAALDEKKHTLQKQRNDLINYEQAMQSKMHEEEQKLLAEVLGQVNSFVQRYAEEHGFDMVLGTTDAGSLLYGEGQMDITQDLLLALNKEHDGL